MSTKVFTEELLITLKRFSSYQISPDKEKILFLVSEQNIKENNSIKELYLMNKDGSDLKLISSPEDKIAEPIFIAKGKKIAYIQKGEIYIMNIDGSSKKKISATGKSNKDINCFLFSENLTKLLVVKSIKVKNPLVQKGSEIYQDCDKANCYIATDLCYNHWDSLQNETNHPFIYDISYDEEKDDIIINDESEKDILEKFNFECPSSPFGGIEEFDMNKEGTKIYFLCRRSKGREYVYSTNIDLFEYTIGKNEVLNICKGVYEKLDESFIVNIHEGINYDISFKTQQQIIQDNVMKIYGEKTFYKKDSKTNKIDMNLGYNLSPKLSPDNKMICWLSMERDGYESDIINLYVFNFETKEKFCVTNDIETHIKDFAWGIDNKTIYFSAEFEGTIPIYKTDIINRKSEIIINEICNFNDIKIIDEDNLLVGKCSIKEPKDLFSINISKKEIKQLTNLNKEKLESIPNIKVEKRMVETFDKKKMLCWVSYPPDFDSSKKYPTLLYCQGGPQCAVNQFWSYRWNFRLMSSKGYIVIAPNRRGLPGFGREWLEEISGDYYNCCMKDYLSAIDDISKENYVDKEKLGAVGASFGGYSVYWLAGNHNKRFKTFISHAGIFNLETFYYETEEMWFALWDNESAPWINFEGKKKENYLHSPHLYVDKWDTPILCIHGVKDYRILHSQGEAAFQAARKRNIPSKLLIFNDEGHWVLSPQNSLVWEREFFAWLDKYLK